MCFRYAIPCLSFLGLTGLFAQNALDHLAPRELGERAPTRKASRASTTVAAEEVLLEKVLGVAIVPEERLGKLGSAQGVQALGFGARETKALAKLARPALNRSASAESLQRLADKLTAWFDEQGRPLTEVYLPEQEITDGQVTFAVHERRVGKVLLQGETPFGREFILRNLRLLPGAELDGTYLQTDLAWINENPFRQVDVAFDEGDAPGLMDVRLVAREQRPWRVYAGYNNHANEQLGEHQALLGLNLGNVWGLDHQLSLQALSSFDERLRAGALVYGLPLPWRHYLELSGIVSRGDPSIGSDLDLVGDVWRLGLKYRVPLAPWRSTRQELFLGMEYQVNRYDFAGETPDQDVQFFSLQAGYSMRWGDALGHTQASLEALISPGWSGHDKEYNALRLGADASYWLVNGRIERHWWLPWDSALLTTVAGQYADEPLLASLRYAATGYGETRGYDESAFLADRALRCTMEWQSNAWSTPLAKVLGSGDQMRAIVFWDYAALNNVGPLPTPSSLSAVGLGLRYQADHFSCKADLAFPLRDLEDHDDGPRLHLSAMWSF